MNTNIISKLKNFVQGNIPVRHDVSDIIIAKAMSHRDYRIKQNRHKNYIAKHLQNNQVTLMVKETQAPKFAFQEILYLFKNEEPNALLLIASRVTVRLSKEEINLYKQKNKQAPKTKQVLRVLFGSTHKPFDEDFHQSLDVPCREDGTPVVDDSIKNKINHMIRFFEKCCNKTLLISQSIKTKDGQVPLLSYLIKKSAQSGGLRREISYVDDSKVRNIFSKLHVFERVNSKALITIASSLFLALFFWQFFVFFDTDNQDEINAKAQEIRILERQNFIKAKELTTIKNELDQKKDVVINKMRSYKERSNDSK